MAVWRFRVKYTDGRELVTKAGPKAQVHTERIMRGLGDQNKLEAMYHMAKTSLALDGQDRTDFDPWLDQVEDVEDLDEEEDANGRTESDPTSQAQSPDGLSS